MNILKLYHLEYPWDVRVEKIIDALAAHGHEVNLVSLAGDGARHGTKSPAIHEHKIPLPRNSALSAVLKFPFFPNWANRAEEVIAARKPDVILARDLVVWPLAYGLASRHRLPLVYDLAEHYPEMLEHRLDGGLGRVQDYVIRHPRIWKAIEYFALRRSDKILVVCEESRDYLVAVSGVPADRIHVVGNTPPRRLALSSPRVSESRSLRLIYMGFLDPSRGIEFVVNTFARHRARLEGNASLEVIGAGISSNRIAETVGRSGLRGMIELRGSMDYARGLERVASSDVGVIPLRATAHYVKSMPNKIFEYMTQGIPVLASDIPPMRRILEETGAGLCFERDNPSDFIAKLDMLRDPHLRMRMAVNGLKWVAEKYNFERDSIELVRALEQVVPKPRPHPSTPSAVLSSNPVRS
jgi:glycosyltransferase involved in cell wall biosynthesis